MPAPQVQPLNVPIASELTRTKDHLGCDNGTRSEIGLLIADCWQQLFLLHKSLAELQKINAQGWEFLNQAFQFPPTVNASRPESIDPAIWRKRSEEARSLVHAMRNAEAKRSILEIADSYEAMASSLESSNLKR